MHKTLHGFIFGEAHVYHFGVAPLNDGGTTYTKAKQKAQNLNKQFKSVFTNEDVPQLDSPAYSKIGDVLFTTRGIQ